MSSNDYLLLVVIVACTACCGSGGCGNKAIETRRQATAAALARYPGEAQSSDAVRLAAIDDPKGKRIEIVNLTDRSIAAPTIWVNQTYLHAAPTIKPRGQASFKYSELIEQGGGVQDLDMADVPVEVVEIEIGDELFTVQGPSRK